MAIENTYLLGKNITLGCGFDLQAKAPLDSRQTVPAFAGLQALIDGNAAYEGMIVYDEETKKTYQAQLVDDVLTFREFGINEAELKDLIASETTAAMEFKGAATALPENPAKGDMYKVTASFKVGEEDVKTGDSIVYNGEQWFIIPSGDDIEDTWRPVTGVDNDSTLTFVAGDKLEKTVAADGTITYKHVAIDAPEDMTAEDDERTRTYITQLITDNHGHIIGFKTATENVEDTNTEYTFEGQSDEATSVYFQVTSNEEGASAEVIYLDAYSKNEADGKFVTKETGKSLVFDTEIARLAEVDNYDDEEVRGLIGDNADAIDALSEYVGTIPSVPGEDGNNKYADLDVIGYINKKAQETLAAASGNSSETAASVKGQLDDYIGENNTRVKAIEDDVAAIKDTETGILKQAKDYADGLAGNYDEKGAAAGVQTALEAEIAKKVDKETYEADKATFAVAETVNTALDLKANKADVVANDTFESFKTTNAQAIADAKAGAVSDVEAKGYAVATEVAGTYATKTELGNVDKKFENYTTTTAQQAIDAEQDRRLGVIEGDYVKSTDIADFETKDNVKKVSDDLAAETKARTDADAGFETRITALEGNFGDGEGTVEAQIAAAVAAEAEIARAAEKANADDIDALEGRMDTAEGKISTLETESAKHAIKTEVESALALKADKSVVDAMYTNEQIDAAILVETNRAKGVEESLQTQIDTIMSNPDAEGAINSINEFTQYVKDHGTIAEGFRTDINANAKAIEDHEKLAAETYATKAELTANENPLVVNSAVYSMWAVSAQEAGKATSDGEDNNIVATYETKTDASGKLTEAKGYTDTEVAKDRARLDILEAINHDAYIAADTALKTELQGEIDADVKVVADDLAGYKTSNDTEVAKKANSADVYAKTETFTKDEVNAAIAAAIETAHTWGSF